VKEALWDNRHRVSWYVVCLHFERFTSLTLLLLLNRSEYITIISIMVAMTVWDFVIGVLFGIIVCCTYGFLAQYSWIFMSYPQVSFSSFRIPNYGVFEPCTRAISRSRLCVGQASSVRIFEKCPNRLLFFVCKVCRSLSSFFPLIRHYSFRFPLFRDDHVCRRNYPKSPRRAVLGTPPYSIPCARFVACSWGRYVVC